MSERAGRAFVYCMAVIGAVALISPNAIAYVLTFGMALLVLLLWGLT